MNTHQSLPIALVTGAGKRIGRSIALSLADKGYSIIVHYHSSKSEAMEVCREISKKNVRAWPLRADLSRPKDLQTLMDRATALGGAVSVLVNNASIFPGSAFESMELADLETVMRTNAWAPLELSRAFAKKNGAGVIINILDARFPDHDKTHVAYSLSKAVLVNITRICAREFAPNIRVSGVAPGLILPPAGKNVSYLKKLRDKVPLRAYGNPQDIADAVVFLVKSKFITGEIIHVDGGRHALTF